MSSSNRRPYLTAMTIDQQLLDFCQDNLDNDLRFIVEIAAPMAFAERFAATVTVGAPGYIEHPDHKRLDGDAIRFETAGTLPTGLALDTTYYVRNPTATAFQVGVAPTGPVLTFVDVGAGMHLFHEAVPKIRISNRNTFVGGRFYEARTTLPQISRTVGEWLSTQVEFSVLDLTINNTDGAYNRILPGGDAYEGMFGRPVTVMVGLRDVLASYRTIFAGTITPEGGIKRDVGRFRIIARDQFDKLNTDFPKTAMTREEFPLIGDDMVGQPLPIIYGDYTTAVLPEGNVAGMVANGEDPDANGETSNTNNVQVVIAGHDLRELDGASIYVLKGQDAWPIDPADVVLSGTSFTDDGPANARFEIIQDSGNTQINDPPENYLFENGDEFLVKVKGKDLGAYSENPVWQARDMLMTYADVGAGEFDANWETYRDKAAPAASAISTMATRYHIKNPQSVLEFVASILEEVRLEFFISRDLKLKLLSNHLEDWQPSPAFLVRQWDLTRDTFAPEADDRNNFNRVRPLYDRDPRSSEMRFQVRPLLNEAAVDQAAGVIARQVFYPGLYSEATVKAQATEILKVASAYTELVAVTTSARLMLLDVGDFVKMNVVISGTRFENVPMMIRSFGFDPSGSKIVLRLWSFQMCPFGNPGGWDPGYTGIVGGDTATITDD